MINRVVVNNFKKFERADFKIKDHLVIAGPNNSGKTTLLQAITAWSEIASIWRSHNPDMSREDDENYPGINLNLMSFYSVPLSDFDHLWKEQNVRRPASIWLHTNEWKIGFEILHKEMELASIRPAKEVSENDLEKYRDNPLLPVYIPPLSGLDIKEPLFDPVVIPARLARMQAGSVLRNLLLAISRDRERWSKLQEIIGDFFGYELASPSGGAEVFARYRHFSSDVSYDMSSGASGFLQVLTVYAALLSGEASVVLIDEPDAHLHVLLQDKMYRGLYEHARESGSQLIVSTHSESLINLVDPRHLRVMRSDGLKAVAEGVERKALGNVLKVLDNEEMVLLQEAENPGILYVEGHTDVSILREWARVLDHRLRSFLERPFWKPVVYDTRDKGKGIGSGDHFEALKLVRGDVKGIELRDSDGGARKPRTLNSGLERIFWKRYEIESYLIHPEAIARFAESAEDEEAAGRALKYLERNIPPAVFHDPLETNKYLKEVKAKDILSSTFHSAGIPETNDYSPIAVVMKKEEIPPEVIEKLDKIADCLGVGEE